MIYLKNPSILHDGHKKKFDMIYVGAEAKTPEEIAEFKNGIPKLLKVKWSCNCTYSWKNYIILLIKKNHWVSAQVSTRFRSLTKKVGVIKKGEEKKSSNTTEKEQKKIIKEERESRISFWM